MHKGRLLYFGKGKGKSDRASYNAAVQQWNAYLRSLENSSSGNPSFDKPASKPLPTNPRGKRWNPRQVTSCVNRFLDSLATKAQAGEINFSRVSDVRARLQRFTKAFAHRLLNELDERDISAFKATQTVRIPKGDAKPSTLRQEFNAVRQLFDWAYKQKVLNERPRNLDDLRITIQRQPPTRFFKPADIQHLFRMCDAGTLNAKWRERAKHGCEMLKAAMLLALNGGLTQKDVSDLTVGEFSLKKRPPRLIRRRSKTGVQMNFILWRVTQAAVAPLLFGKQPSQRVFERPDGKPLILDSTENGKNTGGRSELLGYRFRRLVERSFTPNDDTYTYRFRELRRTGANMCEQRMPDVARLYLAHRDREMKGFYVAPAQKRLDLMMTYMEKDLGFAETLMRLPKRKTE
jgi:hypothetical protein